MIPFVLNQTGSNLHLTLAGEITIEHAHALADELKAVLGSEQILEVDASDLTRLDAAGLQVLLACAQLAADTVLTATSAAWTVAFNRYSSPDPFRTA
jgi:ABC-type transporter Mla MlaB component